MNFPYFWVELYNPSEDEAISLKGWRLGLSGKASDAWAFPDTARIEPSGYIVVFCDKSSGGLHTPFRIDSGKGSIYLFNPRNEIAEQLDLKKQIEPNVAYGRVGDGNDTMGYLTVATPGGSNDGIIASQTLAPEPVFSHKGFVGVSGRDSIDLTVSLPENFKTPAHLCITTNGAEPTISDSVGAAQWTVHIDSTTVVRARIIGADLLPKRATTHSYILHSRETALRVVSIVTDSAYFFSDDEGILMGVLDENPNWENDWRRPVNIEVFNGTDAPATINQIGETRVQGGWSRREPQKSLAVYSNKRFGTKRFYDTLWDDKPDVTAPKSFILRNGGNAFKHSRINDALAHTIIGTNSKSADWQAYSPAIYYINGRYMGITDIRERSNEDYVEANYDGLEDIDMLENHWEVKAGDDIAYNQLLDFIESEDFSAERLLELIDIDNFLDMMVIKVFAHDTDFPYNNIVSWKPTAADGKWRFIIKDVDRLGIWWMREEVENDYYNHIKETSSGDKRHFCYLFSRFYEHPDLFPIFIDRLAIYMGDMLSHTSAIELIDKMSAAIEEEYPDHLQVYYPTDFLGRYEIEWGFKNTVAHLRNQWWPQRINAVYNHLQQNYNLGNPVPLSIHHLDTPVRFNDVELSQSSWRGKYFTGKDIKLSTPAEGTFWRVETYCDGDTTEQRFASAEAHFSIPENATKVRVYLEKPYSSIQTPAAESITVEKAGEAIEITAPEQITLVEVNDLMGRKLHRSSPRSNFAHLDCNFAPTFIIVKVQTATGATRVVKISK